MGFEMYGGCEVLSGDVETKFDDEVLPAGCGVGSRGSIVMGFLR